MKQVGDELAMLQAYRQGQRRLEAAIRNGWQVLREAKATLEPLLESHDYYFHGLTVRRRQVRSDQPRE